MTLVKARLMFYQRFRTMDKNTQDQKRYKHKYKTWEDLVIKQAGNWRFFDDVKHAKVYGLIAGIVALIPGAALYVLGEKFRGFVIIGLALLLAVYSQFIEKRTEFGAANNAQWIGFKKYLRNASQSELPKPELNAWDSFLAYAIPIGRAGDVMEQIPELYDLDELKKSNLFFLHKDNLDKTDYWINSIKKDNRFWVKIRMFLV